MRVAVLGGIEEGFAAELRESSADIAGGMVNGSVALVFCFVNEKSGLREVTKIRKKLKGAAALWVVYPKGKREITENDVLNAGRKAGLKDVKVVGFSPTHTALKFVIPVRKR